MDFFKLIFYIFLRNLSLHFSAASSEHQTETVTQYQSQFFVLNFCIFCFYVFNFSITPVALWTRRKRLWRSFSLFFSPKNKVIRVGCSGLVRFCFFSPAGASGSFLTANNFSLKFVEEPDTPVFVAHLHILHFLSFACDFLFFSSKDGLRSSSISKLMRLLKQFEFNHPKKLLK